MRKLFTRFLRFLLLSVMMVFSTGLYAQESQSTVELFASSVDKCYNATNSYTSTISVKDFIKMKSFSLTLNFDKSEFAFDAVANANALLGGALNPVTATVDNSDPVKGIVKFTWSNTNEVTIGNNVAGGAPLFDVKFKVLNFPNNSGDNLFDSSLAWDVAKSFFYYVSDFGVGGSYQVETTNFFGGTLNVPVSYTAATFAYTVTPAACNGGTAKIAITSPVGTGMKYYFNGSTTASTSPVADAQAPSVNTVRVEDANGCFSHLFTINVSAPSPLVFNKVEAEKPLCFNGQGEIQFDISGGTAPYTYWVVPAGAVHTQLLADLNTSGGVTTLPVFAPYKYNNFQVLKPAGVYKVAVNDANGCLDLRLAANWKDVTITAITSEVTYTATPSVLTCNGAADASIAVTAVAGGTALSEYSVSIDGIHWFATDSKAYTFSALAAGTYALQVKDDNGCTVTSNVVVAPVPAMAFTPTFTDASCAGGATGSISVAAVTGGTGDKTFVVAIAGQPIPVAGWVAVGGTIPNLPANYYSVWVKDANNCVKAYVNPDGSGNVLPIQAPGALTFTTNADNADALEVNCNGTDFTLTAQGFGGTAPYTYSFNAGAYSDVKTFVVAAPTADVSVAVSVKDANGCITTRTVIVDVPTVLALDVFTNPLAPTCSGGTDGRITVNATGGTAPYQYSTDNASWFSNKVLALPEGATTVYVKDSKGCTTSGVATLPTLAVSAFTAAPTAMIACFGNTTTEGIVISDLTWQAGRKIQYLVSSSAATVYTTGTVFVPVSVNTVTPVLPIVSTKFGVGTYYVGARDEYGCTSAVKEVKFTQNPALVLASVTSTNATCATAIDGSLTINTTGGTGTPMYAIVNNFIAIGNLVPGDFQTVETYNVETKVGKQIVQTSKGTYYVVLRDACNTTNLLYAGPFIVDGYKPIALTASPIAKTDITCNDANDGTITVSGVSGGKPEFDGTGLYTYKLYKGGVLVVSTTPNTTGKFTALTAGTYYVTVTDASNCPLVQTAPVTIVNPTVVAITGVTVTHFTCATSNDGIVAITAAGGTGAYMLAVNASVNGLGTDIKASDWIAFPTTGAVKTKNYIATAAGVYKFYVKDANGCVAVAAPVTVLAPKVITAVATLNTPVKCNGGTDGSIDINATGGFESTTFTHTYSFSLKADFSDANATGIFTGLKAGTYKAFVKATNTPAAVGNYTYPAIACTYEVTFVIAEPVEYSYTGLVSKTITCRGGNDGELTVTVIGGGTPFVSLTTGNEYDVQLTTTAFPLLDEAKWTRTTGKVAKLGNLPHAIYSVWIRDAKGCLIATGVEAVPADGIFHKVASWEVAQPATVLAATVTFNNNVTCFGGSDGKFTINATGGVAPYTYVAKISTWPTLQLVPAPSDADWKTSNVFDAQTAATWVIWVKDANGCTVGGEGTITAPIPAYRVVITQPLEITLALAKTDVLCFGGVTGTVAVSGIANGVAPYTFNVSGTDAAGKAVSKDYAGLTAVDGVFTLSGLAATETVHTEPAVAHVHNAYTVKVTDKNGCFSTKTIVVWQNTALEVEIVKANGAFVCPGDNNGVIEAVATGGAGSYTYRLWKDNDVVPFTSWVAIPSFLVEVGSTWKVEVKDANGCLATDEEILNAPVGVTATLSETTCFSDTKASVIVKAVGEAGRTFSVRYRLNTGDFTTWAPFTSELLITNLVFANVIEEENFYYFEVKDDKGCDTKFTKSFVPTQHPLEVIATQSDDQVTASFTISGGISPYSYVVGDATVKLPADGNTVQEIVLVAPGTSVTVYDAHGCFVTKTFVVEAPTLVSKTPVMTTVLTDTHPTFTMTFNRDMMLGDGGNLVVYPVGSTTAALTVAITEEMISGAEVTVDYTTVSGLARSTEYYVLVDGLALTDLAGNAFAGVIGEAAWTFKTGAEWPTAIKPNISQEFKVYPNPFVNGVNVMSTSQLSKVVVTNIVGQVVKEVVNPANYIQLSSLRTGAYFISLYNMDNVIVKTAKIVKR